MRTTVSCLSLTLLFACGAPVSVLPDAQLAPTPNGLLLSGPTEVIQGEPARWTITGPDITTGQSVFLAWGGQQTPGAGRCPFRGLIGSELCLDIHSPVYRVAGSVSDSGAATFDVVVPMTTRQAVYLQAISLDGPDSATSNVLDVDLLRNHDDDADGLHLAEEIELGTDPNEYDTDGDGVGDGDDCEPLDPETHPGALERLDGVDNDCDLDVDEAVVAVVTAGQCRDQQPDNGTLEAQGMIALLDEMKLGANRVDIPAGSGVDPTTDFTDYALVAYTKCGWAWESFNQSDVTALAGVLADDTPLLLFGDDLALGQELVTGASALTLFQPAVSDGVVAEGATLLFDDAVDHPAYAGAFGTPNDFHYNADVDEAMVVADAVVLATHEEFGTPVFAIREAASGMPRQAGILTAATHGATGPLSPTATTNARILFSNTVAWLMDLQFQFDCEVGAVDGWALGTGADCAAVDCAQLRDDNPGAITGRWWVDPTGTEPFEVWCDQDTDGGGWNVVWVNHGGAIGAEESNQSLVSRGNNGGGDAMVVPHDVENISSVHAQLDVWWTNPGQEWLKRMTLWQSDGTVENEQHLRLDMGATAMSDVFVANNGAQCLTMPGPIHLWVNDTIDFGSTDQVFHVFGLDHVYGLANTGYPSGGDACGQGTDNALTDPGDSLYRIDANSSYNTLRGVFSYVHDSAGSDASRCGYSCWSAGNTHSEGFTWAVR